MSSRCREKLFVHLMIIRVRQSGSLRVENPKPSHAGFNRYRGVTEKSVKTLEPVKADWKWGPPEGSRELDRLLDRQLTFREKLEWLEEAEMLSLRLRANREARSNDNCRQRGPGQRKDHRDR